MATTTTTTIPTVEQVNSRLETLIERLRDAVFSAQVTDLGRSVAANNKLGADKVPQLAEVIAWVLMGFVHPSGAADAIREYVGVSPEAAKAVARELDAKLFSAYRADLEKIYTPMAAAPAKMTDIAPVPAKPAAMPAPMSSVPMMPAAPPTSPAAPASAPKPAVPPRFTMPGSRPAAPSAPAAIPARPVPAAPAATPASPAPFMLHQESAASPLAAGSGFKLKVPSDMFKSASPAKKADIPLPPKVAELEIGRTPAAPKVPIGPVTAAPSASRVVHYTDLRTTVAPGFGGADIKPAAPMPPPAPAPAKPPIMPAPPPKPKVVNFGPEEVK